MASGAPAVGSVTPGSDPWSPRARAANIPVPPGYTWDANYLNFIPVVGSPANQLSGQTTARTQEQKLFDLATGAFGAPSSGAPAAASPSGNAPTIPFGAGSSPSLTGLSQAAAPGVAPSGAPGGISPTGSVPTIAPIDNTAANAAAFASAKDQVGREGTGALTGLRSALGGRGMLGSGLEERGTASIINRGQGELGDVSRAQAGKTSDQALAIAEANQGAAVTSRGQDVAARGQDIRARTAANTLAEEAAATGYTGQIAQRGQDITAQSERDRIAMEQAQLIAGQRSQVLSGLMSALSPAGAAY